MWAASDEALLAGLATGDQEANGAPHRLFIERPQYVAPSIETFRHLDAQMLDPQQRLSAICHCEKPAGRRSNLVEGRRRRPEIASLRSQ